MRRTESIESPVYEAGRGSEEAQDAFDDALHQRIRLAAYYRALRRGFAPGGEDQDWYAAEEEERAQKTKRPGDA